MWKPGWRKWNVFQDAASFMKCFNKDKLYNPKKLWSVFVADKTIKSKNTEDPELNFGIEKHLWKRVLVKVLTSLEADRNHIQLTWSRHMSDKKSSYLSTTHLFCIFHDNWTEILMFLFVIIIFSSALALFALIKCVLTFSERDACSSIPFSLCSVRTSLHLTSQDFSTSVPIIQIVITV